MIVSGEQPKEHYASQADRWYDPNTQTSVNDCLAKNGNLKKVTLREARKENYIPSVTSVLQIIAKPGLDKWKKEQVAKAAFAYPFMDGVHEEEDYVDFVLSSAEEQMNKARDLGTEIHTEIDQWLLAEVQTPYSQRTAGICRAFQDAKVEGQRKVVESTFTVKIGDVWVAGKCDLHFPEAEVIFDWKSSKEACDGTRDMGYDEHLIQIASYSMALFGKLVDCRNVFLSTQPEQCVQVRKWDLDELKRGWSMYCHAYALWTLSKQYFPL